MKTQFPLLVAVVLFQVIKTNHMCLAYGSTSRNSPVRTRKSIQLGKLNVTKEFVTLSGFSSGGTFAQHLHISYSSLFKGIAVFNHGYYRCGSGDGIAINYDKTCTLIGSPPRSSLYNPDLAVAEIKENFKMGLIENPVNLRNQKLYVYTGTENWIHSPDISLKILKVYGPFIGNNPYLIRVRAQVANLTLPTTHFGGPCEKDSSANYSLSNCGLSGPYEALYFLLGTTQRMIHSPQVHGNRVSIGPLLTFDQTEFTKNIQGDHWMDTLGFLYIPSKCKSEKCFIHFYFHGCKTGREFVGENHVRNSGWLQLAELNNIIMVFPQIVSNTGQNKFGCWDTYGFTGKYYATQKGGQVTAVRNMIARILGK